VAQIASVIGRQFGFELLQAASGRDKGELEDLLARLVAAGIVFTLHADGTSSVANVSQCGAGGNCSAVPIDLGLATDDVTLELFGTGIRGHSGVVNCKIGASTLPVAYAGPQNTYVGLDQVNIALPKSLRGSGNATVVLSVDGQTANAVTVSFK